MPLPPGGRLGDHRVPRLGGAGLAAVDLEQQTLLIERLDHGHDLLAGEIRHAHLFLSQQQGYDREGADDADADQGDEYEKTSKEPFHELRPYFTQNHYKKQE